MWTGWSIATLPAVVSEASINDWHASLRQRLCGTRFQRNKIVPCQNADMCFSLPLFLFSRIALMIKCQVSL